MSKPFYTVLSNIHEISGNGDLHRTLHVYDENGDDCGSRDHHVLQLQCYDNQTIRLWYGIFNTSKTNIDTMKSFRCVGDDEVSMIMFLDLLASKHPLMPAYAAQLHDSAVSESDINVATGNVMGDAYKKHISNTVTYYHDLMNLPDHWFKRLKATAVGWEFDDLTIITLSTLFPIND